MWGASRPRGVDLVFFRLDLRPVSGKYIERLRRMTRYRDYRVSEGPPDGVRRAAIIPALVAPGPVAYVHRPAFLSASAGPPPLADSFFAFAPDPNLSTAATVDAVDSRATAPFGRS